MEKSKNNNDVIKENTDKNGVAFSEILKIFVRRKWLFISLFIVVMAIGLTVTFSTSPLYKTVSNLKFSNIFYDENLYRYFPAEAEELAIYAPGMKSTELENSNLDKFAQKMRSEDIIKKVAEQLNLPSTVKEINDSITLIQDKGKRIFQIEVSNSDVQTAYNINQKLFEIFISEINSGKTLEALLEKINSSISEINKELAESGSRADVLNNSDVSSKLFILNNLEEMKYNLENNKEIIVKKVEITKEPNKPNSPYNLNYKKNIFIAVFAAIMLSLIAVYLPEIFIRKKKNN